MGNTPDHIECLKIKVPLEPFKHRFLQNKNGSCIRKIIKLTGLRKNLGLPQYKSENNKAEFEKGQIK